MHHKFEASAAGVVVSVSFKRPFSCLTVSMTFFVVTLVSSRLGASSGVRGHLFTKTNLNDGCHQIVFFWSFPDRLFTPLVNIPVTLWHSWIQIMLLFRQHRWLYSSGKLVLAKFNEATNVGKTTCRIFSLYIF